MCETDRNNRTKLTNLITRLLSKYTCKQIGSNKSFQGRKVKKKFKFFAFFV